MLKLHLMLLCLLQKSGTLLGQLLPSSSVSRYQRFLEEELGQLLHSQLSQQFNSQPARFNGQLSSLEGQGGQLNGDQPARLNGQLTSLKRQDNQINGQHLGGPEGKLFNSDEHCRQQHYDQTCMQIGAWPAADLSQRALDHQQPFGLTVHSHPVRNNSTLTGVTAVQAGMLQNPGRQEDEGLSTLKGRHQDRKEACRRALNGIRGTSPLRRQLMLQTRLGLFDSDSSSSSDDDDADGDTQQVGVCLYQASPQNPHSLHGVSWSCNLANYGVHHA